MRNARKSRGWNVVRLVREFRAAAKAMGEHVADDLYHMIYGWESGKHEPNDLHWHLYRTVFPELAARNGDPASPAAVLERAREVPQRADLQQAAQASGEPGLRAQAARRAELLRQIEQNRARLAELIAEQQELLGRVAGDDR